MLALHEKLAQANTPQARRLLEQQIAITDRQIDALVYDLYDLTEEESPSSRKRGARRRRAL